MSSKIPKNFTPLKNILLENFAAGILPYDEMRVALFIIRNTTGYATRDGRRKYTRDLTHAKIAQMIGMARCVVTRKINKMIRENKIKKDGRKYMLNYNFEDWCMLEKATVENINKKSSKKQQKRLEKATKNVGNYNIDQPSKPSQAIVSATHKETIKETVKENLKESECVDINKEELEKLLLRYKEAYRTHLGEDYRERDPVNSGRDISLLNEICKKINNDCSHWQDHSKSLYEHVGQIIDLFFERYSDDARRMGLPGLVMKTKDLDQILNTQLTQKVVLSRG